MTDEIKCPECKKQMKLLPEQKASPETITGSTHLQFYTAAVTAQLYSPTSKTFKCSNPECWVTKLELSWS